MCGICGIVGGSGPMPRDVLHRMSAALSHRGPDESTESIDGSMALGFRRLAIIDVAGGHQPMTNEDGSLELVFNGEIYNFEALRAELLATGRHTLKTLSDTETILHLYEEYGQACVDRLRGMFAFAIWDKRRKTLFAARDRFGKKPFYYFKHASENFIFASELKALRQHPQCPSEIDPQAVDDYLALQYIPAPRTIYRGVFKLPAAHRLVWSAQEGVKTERYWDLRYEPKATVSYAEAKERLKARLEESVRLRMISEVPLGAFLSGGIDSSIIVALMAKQSPKPVKTFSIGFEEKDYSELSYARLVAERYRTDHHEFIVKPALVDVLPTVAASYSEPYADPSALPSYFLAKETRRFVTVALTGDGGDELFAGYLRYRASWAMTFWNRLPLAARRSALIAGETFLGRPESGKSARARALHLLRVGAMPRDRQYLRTLHFFQPEELAQLWRPELQSAIDTPGAEAAALFETTLQSYRPEAVIDQMMYLDLHHYLPDGLMTKTDISSMAHSLEARCPLLDHVLAEEVARYPVSWKYHPWFGSKRLLRDAFHDDLLPEIRGRGKQGFGVPLATWFRGPLKGYLRETLLDPKALGARLFHRSALETYLKEHEDGRRDRSHGLWALLMLEQWYATSHAGKDQNAPVA